MRTASRADAPGQEPIPVARTGADVVTSTVRRVPRRRPGPARHRPTARARAHRPRSAAARHRTRPRRSPPRGRSGPGARLEQPASVGDGEGHRERRGLLAAGRRPYLAGAPGQEAVREPVEGAGALGAGQGHELAVDDGRAVVGRRLERRVGDDEPVDGHDRQGGGCAGGHPAQRARPGRAVQQDAVAVAGEEHRDDPRPAVDDGRQRAGEDLVEERVEGAALGAAALGVASEPLGGAVGVRETGVAGAGTLPRGHHALGGGGGAAQRVADPGRARHELAAAVRAHPLEVLGTPRAERALVGTDDRPHGVGGQVGVAALARRAHLQGHGLIIAPRTDDGRPVHPAGP